MALYLGGSDFGSRSFGDPVREYPYPLTTTKGSWLYSPAGKTALPSDTCRLWVKWISGNTCRPAGHPEWIIGQFRHSQSLIPGLSDVRREPSAKGASFIRNSTVGESMYFWKFSFSVQK